MIPRIPNEITHVLSQAVQSPDWAHRYHYHKDPSFRLVTSWISGDVRRLEALKQSLFHAFHTERYIYPIYPSNYGIEMEKYRQEGFAYFKTDIGRNINDTAMFFADRVTGTTVVSIENPYLHVGTVTFLVHSIFGDLEYVGEGFRYGEVA